jgi:predicted HicB family RNase H-like nuclease
MAIARRPNSKPKPDAEAERFIAGAGAAPPSSDAVPKGRIATMVRFDAALLAKVNAAAKRRGISRSAWIQYTLSQALEDDRS